MREGPERGGWRERALSGLLFCTLSGCAGQPPNEVTAVDEAVVYGADDRVDPGVGTSADHLSLDGVVALVPRSAIVASDGDSIRLRAPTLDERMPWCEPSPFGLQPSLAGCSAVLLARNVVLTAEHCVSRGLDCEQLAMLLHFVAAPNSGGSAELSYASHDLYLCRKVLARDSAHDLALLRADRDVDAPPARISIRAPAVGDAVIAVGFPGGVPMKVDAGGVILDEDPSGELRASIDALFGSSGSPVFDPEGELVGTLVSGAPDLSYGDDCVSERTLEPDAGDARGEVVVPVGHALHMLQDVRDDDAPEPVVMATRLDGTGSGLACSTTVGAAHSRRTQAALWGAVLALLIARRRRRVRSVVTNEDTCSHLD